MYPSSKKRKAGAISTDVEFIDLTSDTHISLLEEDDDSRDSHKNSIDSIEDDDVYEVLPALAPAAARDFEIARVQRIGALRNYKFLNHARGGRRNIRLTPAMRVELRPNASGEIHYLHIRHILQDQKGDIYLRGTSLKRHWYIYPGKKPKLFLPQTKNDLCMDLKTTPDKIANPLDWETMISVPLSEVEKEREIVFTNLHYTEFGYKHRGMSVEIDGYERVEREGLLCVRWKFAQEILNGKVVGMHVMPLGEVECDEGHARPSILKLRRYGKLWHLSQQEANGLATPPTLPIDAEYTFGDGCAGGGLISRAITMAGGKLVWALDINSTCAATLKTNFPEALVIEDDIQRFATKICPIEDYSVDVLHISFPCQGHSLRNMGTNPERDMKNNETILSLEDLLKHVRPRIVTLEQTDGIMSKNDGWWYSKLLSILADAGYAIRTRKINMAEYDNPHPRKRLMIYAACPGQKLPDWPLPTCGPGLKEYRTIRQTIRRIPTNDPLHDIEAHKERHRIRPRNLEEADMDRPLGPLIDTAGAHVLFRDSDGLLYWPTLRQQMRLQGVPDEHTFVWRTQEDHTTQNGNGVPCGFGKLFFGTTLEALRESDRELEEWWTEVEMTG